MSRIDSLELWVLSVARKVFLFVAALAMLSMIAGLVTVIASGVYFLAAKPSEPAVPPRPDPLPEVSLADARKAIEGGKIHYDPAEYTPEVRDGDALAAADRLKGVYGAPDFDWDDTIDTVCTAQTSYGCLSRERRVTKVGMRRWLATYLQILDEKHFPVQDGVTRALQLLPKAAANERAELATAIIIAVKDRQDKQQAQDDEYDDTVRRLQRDYDDAKFQHRAAAVGGASLGLSALGGGLGLVLSICLMVAVLAIERHLRAGSVVG